MFEVIFKQSDGVSSEITSDWERTIDENRPYLEPGDKIIVGDENGDRVYYERVSQ